MRTLFPEEHGCFLEVGLSQHEECSMNSIIYIIGLIVVVLAILSFLGLA